MRYLAGAGLLVVLAIVCLAGFAVTTLLAWVLSAIGRGIVRLHDRARGWG